MTSKVLLKAIGAFLITTSIIVLYSWVNKSDPDCYYTTEVAFQARLCGEAYIGETQLPNIAIYIICLVLLFLGFFLIKSSSKQEKTDTVSSEEGNLNET